MPAYKDNKTGKWYVKINYKDFKGKSRQKLKRGFNLKREAQEFESNFLANINVDLSIPFNEFVDIYFMSIKPKIRMKTYVSKQKHFNRIIKYFDNIPFDKIDNNMVSDFMNTLIIDNLSNNTIKTIKKELSAIFNYAIKFHGYKNNPTHNLGNIYNPNSMDKKYIIWSIDDYNKAIENINDIELKTLINLLYWSGMRIGECLALKWSDINFSNKTVTIDKSYQRIQGKEYITPTKTYNTRTILLPDTTIKQLQEYKKVIYDTNNRLFLRSNENYLKRLKVVCRDNDLPRISLYDLRHSHASYLLGNNINIVLISKRLGHDNTTTTLNIYSHFLPSDEIDFINDINKIV